MGQKHFGPKNRIILINDFSEQEKEFFRKQSLSEKKYDKVEWTPDQRKRLTALLNGDSEEASVIDGSTSYVCIASLDQQLSLFKKRFPEWNREDSIIFFNSYPDLNDLKVLRRQIRESGLCFMHAPVVLQHYLVSIYNHKNKKKNSMEMIDVAKYIATCWKGERLLNYLLHGLGGSSIEFLKEINYHVQPFQYIMKTLPDPLNEEMNEDFQQVCEWCLKNLQSVPGLVSNFEVDSNLASAGISLLDQKIVRDEDPNKKNGHHAMILIGIRPDPTYRYVFLLQNWWRGTENELGRFVIQVSARYMAEAGAQITFVYSDIPEIPTSFPKVYRPYAETSADVSEKMTER